MEKEGHYVQKEKRWKEEMKIPIKHKGKTELAYIDPTDIVVGTRTLGDILAYVDDLEKTVQLLTTLLEHSTIIRKGDIVGLNGGVFEVQDVTVFKEQPKHDLKWYKVDGGQLVLDQMKVRKIL